MADNVIRQDIIELGFDVGSGIEDLTKINKEIDEMKKDLTGGIGDDAFDGMQKSAKELVRSGLSKVDEKLTKIANTAVGAAYKGLKKIAGISFKALAVGIAGAATAVAGLVGSAASAYADYEQLVGGVDTLFKKSSSVVQKNANDAYKTAGLSANQYMETVTSFSASLISSLDGDTAKAAELAHTAIVDMSDNANKMGTDMGSLQYAYQGFAKQNYTMLKGYLAA